MKKIFILLLLIFLIGCESQHAPTKAVTIKDISLDLPKDWKDGKENTDENYYYYPENGMLFVNIQDTQLEFNSITLDEFIDGLSEEMQDFELKSKKVKKINNADCFYVLSNVKIDDQKYKSMLYAFNYGDFLYSITLYSKDNQELEDFEKIIDSISFAEEEIKIDFSSDLKSQISKNNLDKYYIDLISAIVLEKFTVNIEISSPIYLSDFARIACDFAKENGKNYPCEVTINYFEEDEIISWLSTDLETGFLHNSFIGTDQIDVTIEELRNVPVSTTPESNSNATTESTTKEKQDKTSIDTMKGLVESALLENFGDDFYTDLTTDSKGNLTFNVSADGIALETTMAAQGDEKYIKSYEGLKSSMISMSKSASDLMDTCGYDEQVFMINVLNDLDKTKTLLTVVDGVVLYDCLSSK